MIRSIPPEEAFLNALIGSTFVYFIIRNLIIYALGYGKLKRKPYSFASYFLLVLFSMPMCANLGSGDNRHVVTFVILGILPSIFLTRKKLQIEYMKEEELEESCLVKNKTNDRRTYNASKRTGVGKEVIAECPSCGKHVRTLKSKLKHPLDCPKCGSCGIFTKCPERRAQDIEKIVDLNKRKKCPSCGKLIRLNSGRCRYCKEDV